MRPRLPHALVVAGPAGVGKRALAEHFAQSLLCEKGHESTNPCGGCAACRWFSEGNHPDFRLVVPEVLALESATAIGEEAANTDPATAKSRSAPSKNIRIDQIRALESFFQVGTHRGGRRVVLIYPADKLNPEAGNILLKVLEEPPDGTLFLLVTGRPHELLPTVRSRCARFELARPDPATMLLWLREQGVEAPEVALAEAGGAPLAAVAEDPAAEIRELLLAGLAADRLPDPIALAEKCEKAGLQNVCLWLTRWICDLIAVNAGAAVRYHPQHGRRLATLGMGIDAVATHAYYRRLMRSRRAADHPLNARLFTEELLIDYARLVAARS